MTKFFGGFRLELNIYEKREKRLLENSFLPSLTVRRNNVTCDIMSYLTCSGQKRNRNTPGNGLLDLPTRLQIASVV